MGDDKIEYDEGGVLPRGEQPLIITRKGDRVFTLQQWRDFLDER